MVGVSDEDGSFNPDTAAYSWTGPNGFTSDKQKFVATAIGEYFVTVTTTEGCIGEDSIIVSSTSCTIQKGISPNNDGSNDYFDLTELMVKHLGIFNRYGQEVYSKDNYTNEWNGQTSKGDELPTGTYFYMIELMNGESKTGWIYINRQD
jgi:gliding motility-associated-like protein